MPDKDTQRVEAFSDGVFAIAITLLILEIKVPRIAADASGGELLRALGELWPSFVAFLLSFGTILELGKRYKVWSEDGSVQKAEFSGQTLMKRGLEVRLPEVNSSDLIFVEELP